MHNSTVQFRPVGRLLIANRGEIAVRIHRTAKRMGLTTIGVVTQAEPETQADEAAWLQGDTLAATYLNADALVALALKYEADALHPGYGFLSENADFAAKVEAAGLLWVGPAPEAIRRMGDKVEARKTAQELGLPLTASAEGSLEEVLSQSTRLNYPLLIKAAAGGGGKGMVKIADEQALLERLPQTAREAASYFGDDRLYVEEYLEAPHHIEVQVLGDRHGNLLHLYERECSIQRRYQKIIEEAPSSNISAEKRAELTADALRLCRAIGYYSVGTVEFLVDAKGRHYFLEMNTRLQVEHPVTERITGLDLVEEQLKVAMGLPLDLTQEQITCKGHAIESRIYAEDPLNDFSPAPGRLLKVQWPAAELARTDTWIEGAAEVKPDFDPMVAKIITHAATRTEAIQKHLLALEQVQLGGLTHNTDYLLQVLRSEAFGAGHTTTAFCSNFKYQSANHLNPEVVAVAGLLQLLRGRDQGATLWQQMGFWRQEQESTLQVNDHLYHLNWEQSDHALWVAVNQQNRFRVEELEWKGDRLRFVLAGKVLHFDSYPAEKDCFVLVHKASSYRVSRPRAVLRRSQHPSGTASSNQVTAPIPGRIVELKVQAGDTVEAGQSLLVLEAMKMENHLKAERSGVVRSVHAAVGQQVKAKQILVDIDNK